MRTGNLAVNTVSHVYSSTVQNGEERVTLVSNAALPTAASSNETLHKSKLCEKTSERSSFLIPPTRMLCYRETVQQIEESIFDF